MKFCYYEWMSGAIATPDQARQWLDGQPLPLQAPAQSTDAWERRLIEASAWLSLAPLKGLIKATRKSHWPVMTLEHEGACVALRVGSQGDTKGVDPAIHAYVPTTDSNVNLSAPAHALGLPEALVEAMGNGTLALALNRQCEGLFELPLSTPLLECLASRLGEAHEWVAEHRHEHLSQSLGQSVATPHRSRF